MYFWRTSRIFSWRLCLFGKMSLCDICRKEKSIKIRKTFTFLCQGQRRWEIPSKIESGRRRMKSWEFPLAHCSYLETVSRLGGWEHAVFLEQLHHQLPSLLKNLSVSLFVGVVARGSLWGRFWCSRGAVGVVFGCEHCVDAIYKILKRIFSFNCPSRPKSENSHLNWSMLKSGPKKRFPMRNDGVADDMALRSDCSSSVGAANKQKSVNKGREMNFLNSRHAIESSSLLGFGICWGFLR